MSLVTISYDGEVIHETDYNGTVTLNTDGAYMDGNVEIVVAGEEILPTAEGVSF